MLLAALASAHLLYLTAAVSGDYLGLMRYFNAGLLSMAVLTLLRARAPRAALRQRAGRPGHRIPGAAIGSSRPAWPPSCCCWPARPGAALAPRQRPDRAWSSGWPETLARGACRCGSCTPATRLSIGLLVGARRTAWSCAWLPAHDRRPASVMILAWSRTALGHSGPSAADRPQHGPELRAHHPGRRGWRRAAAERRRLAARLPATRWPPAPFVAFFPDDDPSADAGRPAAPVMRIAGARRRAGRAATRASIQASAAQPSRGRRYRYRPAPLPATVAAPASASAGSAAAPPPALRQRMHALQRIAGAHARVALRQACGSVMNNSREVPRRLPPGFSPPQSAEPFQRLLQFRARPHGRIPRQRARCQASSSAWQAPCPDVGRVRGIAHQQHIARANGPAAPGRTAIRRRPEAAWHR